MRTLRLGEADNVIQDIHYADAKPKVLLACQSSEFDGWKDDPFIGRLITPQFRGEVHRYTGVDNCAYTNWEPKQFVETLLSIRESAARVRWVASPDTVGDWEQTLYKFGAWGDVIRGLGFRVSYVLQDGQPENSVPWHDIRAVFLGGSTEYKLSDDAYSLCKIAKDRGKLVHVGRVNSLKRVSRFFDVMDSFDGLSYSKFRNVKLPMVLKLLRSRLESKRLQ